MDRASRIRNVGMTEPELDKIAMEVFDDLSKEGTVEVEEIQLLVELVNTRRFDEKTEMKLVKRSGQLYEREPGLYARGCGKMNKFTEHKY